MTFRDQVIHLQNGRLAPDTPSDVVRRIVDQAVADPENGIVIHFHGGLVNYANGMATAEKLYPEYLSAGTVPIFFVWESGLLETITRNLGEIGTERIFGILWKRLANIVLKKDSQSGADRAASVLPPVDDQLVQESIDKALATSDEADLIANEPSIGAGIGEMTPDEESSLETALSYDFELQTAIQEVSQGLRDPDEIEADLQERSGTAIASTETLMDPSTLEDLVERSSPSDRGLVSSAMMIRKIASIAARIVHRFVKGRDHGFHATIVEEILHGLYLANVGEIIWSQMKQDTSDAFSTDTNGGATFVAALAAAVGQDAWPRITLIGHSTGAVYISEFLDHASSELPAAARFGVIFEAPASTINKTARTLTQHSERISGFRMFTMSDAYEKRDELVPVLYPHSLLYFVSGVVEADTDTPIVGMGRFFDRTAFPDAKFPDIKSVRDHLAAADGAVWSVTDATAPEGRRSHGETHTSFDYEDDKTLESVLHILTNGF